MNNTRKEVDIEKDTDLILKEISGNTTTETIYEFEVVDDSVFTEPDSSEYDLHW